MRQQPDTVSHPRRFVGYVRISKDRPGETSTKTQEQSIRAWALALGHELVEIIVEPGRSAYGASRSSRPGMRKALRFIESGAADGFVSWKLDRVARNARDFLNFLHEDLEAHGASYVSVTETFDTSLPMGKTMITIIAALAEMESATKSDRTKEWHVGRRAAQLAPTGPCPFGYRRSGNTLVIDETNAEHVRFAAELILNGASVREVARQMADRGVKMDRYRVPKILTSPVIAGLRRAPNSDVFTEGNWTPILDRATYDELREVLLAPGRRSGPRSPRRWMLSGLATCGRCRTPIQYIGRSAAGPRYGCPACRLSIDATKTDDAVSGDVLEQLTPLAWKRLRRLGRPVDTSGLEAELIELAELKAETDMPLAEWKVLRKGIQQRIDEAMAEPVALPDVADIRTAWPDLPVSARRLVVEAVVESIEVEPAKRGANVFDESRIRLSGWRA